jgi:hypothetical protein
MALDEAHHLFSGRDLGVRQVQECGQNHLALPHLTQGDFTDDERMDRHATAVQEFDERGVVPAQVVDPDGGVDRDHAPAGAPARASRSGSLPPRRARRGALSRFILKALKIAVRRGKADHNLMAALHVLETRTGVSRCMVCNEPRFDEDNPCRGSIEHKASGRGFSFLVYRPTR